MIKQIQLRGISRTPSDRMVEDGGVSESLNMYLDSAESAPLLMPKPADLGLPEDLEAERIFLHKTANYEHYIVANTRGVVAYVEGKEQELLSFKEGEDLLDLNSLGNVLVLATSSSVHYILWKGEAYSYIGNKIPTPVVRFETEHNNEVYLEPTKASGQISLDTSGSVAGRTLISQFRADVWQLAARGVYKIEEANNYLKKVNDDLWAEIQKKKNMVAKWGYFCCPRFVRYAVRLYDGSYIYHSVPFLIGAGNNSWISVNGHATTNSQDNLLYSRIQFFINRYYKAVAKLISWDVDGWEDIISGLDVFISTDITFPLINSSFKGVDDGGGKIYFKGDDNAFEVSKNEVLSKTNFYKVFSVGVRELSKLKDGIDLHDNDFVDDSSLLVQQEQLTSDYMANHSIIPSSMAILNNSLLINGSAIYLPDAPQELNGLVAGNGVARESFRIKFYLKKNNGDVYSILARNKDGGLDIPTPQFPYYDEQGKPNVVNTYPYAWIAYPDPSCFKVEFLTVNEGRLYSIDMEQHPYLYLSCAYLGLGKALTDSTDVPGVFDASEERDKYSIENQVMVSMTNNPFVFPVEGRYTFQSKVLGLAIATAALSQGQFGQFPLYVFTEDGIWAMETGADGSFVTSKPLSREVCSNPDSITSIDNAVVFVTKKGVMLLQGSEIVELSPNMNGRHYFPNDAATSLIGNQEEYSNLVDTIKDKDSFVSFMQAAKVAYDYAGQRLIFISPSNEGFQYLYKLDTQTWHKMSVGKNLVQPLNSYPECLVQCNLGTKQRKIFSVTSIENSQLTADMLADDFIDLFPDSGVTRDEWFSVFIMQNTVDVSGWNEGDIRKMEDYLRNGRVDCEIAESTYEQSAVLDFSTHLDVSFSQDTAKGIIITRPFDLGEPDVYKTIKTIKIRGDYDKGNVKNFIQGSDDGRTFYNLTSLRGKSWKMFRLFILADLEPTERISWVDIEYETRFKNRLR